MIKKRFLGLVMCLSMAVVFLCAGQASAVDVYGVSSVGDACTPDTNCSDGDFCNGVEECDIAEGFCIAGTFPCSGDTSVCIEEGDGTCVECDIDSDCGDGNPVCVANKCEECEFADTCFNDDNFCTGVPTCEENVCSFSGDPCEGEAPTDFCNGTACVVPPECEENSDCGDDGAFCNGLTICTVDKKCSSAGSPCEGATPECKEEGDGTCVECVSDDNCTGFCVGNECVDCEEDADCYDGIFCNGVESCNAGGCVESIDPCAFLGLLCDEDLAGCAECLTDSDCDDDAFCNGDETCVDGACLPGTKPCEASETCIEETEECITPPGCESDADCEDDLFCNGEETCADGVCVPGSDPCEADETCDEQAEECVLDEACETDADCDSDGLFCSGIEVCVLSASAEATPVDQGICESSGNPCEAGETCDEEDNTCEVAAGGILQIDKCKVKAGKNGKGDSIKFSGLLDAEEADFPMGGEVVVIIEAAAIPDLNATTFVFSVDEDSLKKGKYKSPKDKTDPVASLQIDTNKDKVKFSVKNADLTGLGCPITVTIQIGDYVAEYELGEEIVNGKKPCPPELLE